MATRDEKGYIHYSSEELNRIPSYEQRDNGRAPLAGGLTGATLGAVAGGAVGGTAGPGGALAGAAAGTVLGSQAARATGAVANQGAGKK